MEFVHANSMLTPCRSHAKFLGDVLQMRQNEIATQFKYRDKTRGYSCKLVQRMVYCNQFKGTKNTLLII
jgi:hypothetical protein